MSVEKFHLINKANRGFEAIADALLDDVYEDDFEDNLVVDDEGNVYALVGEIEKSDDSHRGAKIGAGIGAGGAAALTAAQAKELRSGWAVGRLVGMSNKDLRRAYTKGLSRRAVLSTGTGAAVGAGVDYANRNKVEKGLPSVQRAMLRAAEKTGDHSAINAHWAHSTKIQNKQIGQEVSGKPMAYLRGGRTTDPTRIAQLKTIGAEKKADRLKWANKKDGKLGLRPSTVNPGMSVKESSTSLAGQREAALRARRPVQIRGGEQNRPAW